MITTLYERGSMQAVVSPGGQSTLPWGVFALSSHDQCLPLYDEKVDSYWDPYHAVSLNAAHCNTQCSIYWGLGHGASMSSVSWLIITTLFTTLYVGQYHSICFTRIIYPLNIAVACQCAHVEVSRLNSHSSTLVSWCGGDHHHSL